MFHLRLYHRITAAAAFSDDDQRQFYCMVLGNRPQRHSCAYCSPQSFLNAMYMYTGIYSINPLLSSQIYFRLNSIF
jgi:hypothetical protein